MPSNGDDANLDHIAEHGIEPDEAEDAALDPDRVPARANRSRMEERRAVIGATQEGRILVVVYTVRGTAVRVVTAYDAGERRKRQYRRGRK